MKADIRWLDQPEVFRVNQLPAHSDHEFYQNRKEWEGGSSSFAQSLNGIWKFSYAKNPMERPRGFYKEGYDSKDFDEIAVPKHIELAGYDKIHYINRMYPWEGHCFRRPAYTGTDGLAAEGTFSEADYNPVGTYLRSFDLEEGLRGQRVYIRFEGMEQAMYVWLNGTFIGYGEDSFTPSEFDLSGVIRDKGNVLAVEVYKQSTAAFLEDQDFFRFFGIFRDVSLHGKPKVHLEDLWVQPEYQLETGMGQVNLKLEFSSLEEAGKVRITIKSSEKVQYRETEDICGCTKVSCLLPEEVVPWEHGNPNLYTLELEVQDKEGNLTEFIPWRFGFRRIELRNKMMYLNGKRLVINGVNRHEWSPLGGRCISNKEELWDMRCIKDNHINAVRTSHYPNRISWYSLCDQEGIYLMAETNLESHGSWQKRGAVEPSWNVPGSFPKWEAAVLDRARTNFEVFKNHTSILFWSLGNESYAGEAIRKMNQFFKEKDSSRLVHYEGVFHNRAYEDSISDMESQMYSSPQQVIEYLEDNPRKPFILCEYMHDMGNSMGGLSSYIELLEKYDLYQGGFIWDFIDQALWVTDEVTGQKVLRYGGDFDDRPSDYEFSGNGIVFADRSEKPAMQEVRYYYGKHQ